MCHYSAPSSRFVHEDGAAGELLNGGCGGESIGCGGAARAASAAIATSCTPLSADGLTHTTVVGVAAAAAVGSADDQLQAVPGPVDEFRLKPDLNTEELNSKRANLERVKMFSRNLKIINTEWGARGARRAREGEAAGAKGADQGPEGARVRAGRRAACPHQREEADGSLPRPVARARAAAPTSIRDRTTATMRSHSSSGNMRSMRQAALIRAELGL